MSIQINRGLILTGAMANPFHVTATIRPVLMGVATNLWRTLLAENVASYIDATRTGERVDADDHTTVSKSIHILGALWSRRMKEVEAATGDDRHRNPGTDLGMSIQILAHPDRPDAVLAIVRAEESVYYDTLLKMDGVADFSYWQAEYPPQGVTRPDWDARNDVWGRALLDGRSTTLGWTWKLLPWPVELTLPRWKAPGEPEQILAAMPNEEERAFNLARNIARRTVRFDMDDIGKSLREIERVRVEGLPAARELISPITLADLMGPPVEGPTS